MSAGPEDLARRVRAAGVRDVRVLRAVAKVPRAAFVPASAERRAYRVERLADLAHAAVGTLSRHGAGNIEVMVADGTAGLEARAPFEAIVVSAAFTSVPRPLAAQLAPGGRLVQPVGRGGHDEVVLFQRGSAGRVRRRSVTPAHFVKLYWAHGLDDG